MKIKITEKVILTEKEMNTINETYGIIGNLFRMTSSYNEIENQLSELLTALSNFIDKVEVELDNN